MSTLDGPVDLGALLDAGCTMSIERGMSFTRGRVWTARILEPTTTRSGNVGKPKHVFTLVANGDTVLDLLRELTEAIDFGPMEQA